MIAWFDDWYYARQKAAQMNAIGWRDANGQSRTDWEPGEWPEALARFNHEHHTAWTPYDNFLACNTLDYAADIPMSAVNVSPNPLFNIPVYLTNLASHYNSAGFEADGFAAGQWTAASALEYLFEVERISAWKHFAAYGLEQRINPSNEFDTEAYLLARASAMGPGNTVADAIAELLANGNNPIEDYFIWGIPHGIEAVEVVDKTVAGIGAAQVWGGAADIPEEQPDDAPSDNPTEDGNGGSGASGGNSGGSGSNSSGNSGDSGSNGGAVETPGQPAVRDDPYDQDYVVEEIGKTVTGAAGRNTWFTGQYGGSGDGGLTPDSVITGGANAKNSLVIALESDWPGFNGREVDGRMEANVVNVGRVVLNHGAGDDRLEFNAANIDSPLQFDLNNNGEGSISLADLPATVQEINITGIADGGSGAAPETALEFAQPQKSLRIGLEDVCADDVAGAPIVFSGIEEVELASYGSGNAINLAEAGGIRKLSVMNGAALSITGCSGETIEEYDASRATADVKLAVSAFRDGAVVKGGAGNDSLVFLDDVDVENAVWTGIENIIFNDSAYVNARQATGIGNIWQMGSQEVRVENLDAEDLVFYTVDGAESLARSCAKGVVSGSIGNITWSSCGINAAGSELTADFVCDATGDCVIKLEGRDKLGVSSVFELPQLTGTITIDDPNPTNPDSYNDPRIEGIKLLAEQATGLHVTHAGSMKICGALWKVEDVRAEMTDTSAGYGLFKLPELPSARNVDIAADRMDVYISGLGTEGNGLGMDVNISKAANVYIGGMEGASGANIKARIESFGDTEIALIKTGGDVDVAVSGVNIVAEDNGYGVNDGFSGASVNLDFSDVHGNVGHANMMILGEALGGSLNYVGARGDDYFLVGGLTSGAISRVDTGAGNNEVVVQTLDSIGDNGLATLNMVFGSGTDILRVYNMAQHGNLVINVSGASGAGKLITKDCSSNALINDYESANLALATVNAGFQLDADTEVNGGVFEYGGNAYWIAGQIDADSAHDVTLVSALGASASLFQDDDLEGA